jgi:hypothetical protein
MGIEYPSLSDAIRWTREEIRKRDLKQNIDLDANHEPK